MYHETLSATDEQLDPGLKRPSPVQAITSFLGCNQEWINTTADKISLWWDCRIPRKRSLTDTRVPIVYKRNLMMPPRLKNNLQWDFVRYYWVLSHRHAVILVGVKAADMFSERRDYIVGSYISMKVRRFIKSANTITPPRKGQRQCSLPGSTLPPKKTRECTTVTYLAKRKTSDLRYISC